jgi:hypothetical protein
MKADSRFRSCKNLAVGLITPIIVLVLMVTWSHALFEGKVESFSAENVEINSKGKIVNKSKLYITPEAIRMDGMPGQGGPNKPKLNLTMLILKKQNRQYLYNHDKKLVFVSPIDEINLKPGYQSIGETQSEKILGEDKVSGYKCVKKEVVTNYEIMGRKFQNKLLVWESDKFDFPLRTQDEDGNIQEMRKIRTGKIPKKTFRPLTGYKKVDNMMAAMGMDFSEMAKQDKSQDEEKRETNLKNPEEVDVDKVMAQMKSAMGKDADPEQLAQVEQAMRHAMSQAKETRMGEGAADTIWEFIPRRPGDKVADEMKTTNTLNVVMGTKAALKAVFNFYQNKLLKDGWQDGGMHIQNDQGFMTLMKGRKTLMISSADNPGMGGKFSLFYNIKLSGPDI